MGRRALFLAIGAVAVAGCGSSSSDDTATSASPKTVDDAQVEQGIEQDLSTSSAKVTSAKCPSDVPVEKGDTFNCTVTFDNGATGKAKVTQQGANRYTYELVSGSVQIPGATVEKALQEDLAKQGIQNATVNCPDNIIVKVDSPVTCDVTSASGKATSSVTFTFSDASGDIDTSSVDAS